MMRTGSLLFVLIIAVLMFAGCASDSAEQANMVKRQKGTIQ